MLTSVRKHTTESEQVKAPKKPSRKYREAKIQALVVEWLRHRPDWMVMRTENAGERSLAAAARAKAHGLREGCPDLWVCYKTHPAWLELKDVDGVVSPAQHQCHAELRARGQVVLIAFGFEECVEILSAFALVIE